MAKNRIEIKPLAGHPAPVVLTPHDRDGDPAPLITTLARVALAIAQRRTPREQKPTRTEATP